MLHILQLIPHCNKVSPSPGHNPIHLQEWQQKRNDRLELELGVRAMSRSHHSAGSPSGSEHAHRGCSQISPRDAPFQLPGLSARGGSGLLRFHPSLLALWLSCHSAVQLSQQSTCRAESSSPESRTSEASMDPKRKRKPQNTAHKKKLQNPAFYGLGLIR